MIDFHTHILPNVDDGSKGVEESTLMLTRLFEQGVNKVIATPHFYANDESVDEFLLRRNAAFEKLSKNGCDVSKIILGAEVRYYDGISHLQDLKKLRIEGTRFLLLEMPFNKWTDYAINEVIDIANRGKISLVLAHIDRYLPIISKSVIAKLSANGVLFQANSSFFDSFFANCACMSAKSLQSCLTLCDSMDCSPPGSFVHGIFQARILEWVSIPFSKGFSQSRDQTQVSCIGGRLFTI